MKCPNCGGENRSIARFCQHCGTTLTSTEPLEKPRADTELTTETGVGAWNVAECAEQITGISAPGVEPREMVLAETGETVPAPESVQSDGCLVEGDSAEAKGLEPVGEDTAVDVTLLASEEATMGGDGSQLDQAPPAVETESTGLSMGGQPSNMAHTESGPVGKTERILETMGDEATADVSPVTGEQSIPTTESEGGQEEQGEQAGGLAEPSVTAAGGTEREDVQELANAHLLSWSDRSARMPVVGPGTVVHGRYLVVELLSDQESENLYRVRDLQRCAQCGSTANGPDEAFCSACGAAMEQKPMAVMLERRADQSNEPIEAEVEDQFSEGKSAYWVWREEKKTGPLGGAEQPMRLAVGQRSDTGRVRTLNEDSVFTLVMSYLRQSVVSQWGLFIVADGMGGQEAGEVASQTAIQVAARELAQDLLVTEVGGKSLTSEQVQQRMSRALEAANERVYLERQKRENDMGTTMTATLVRDWMLYVAHVGDCRAYRWGQDGWQQLTTDHSVVASMVAAGTAKPEEIYTHPQRNVIYRCIGDRATVEVDVAALALSPGDRLVLCSDGLWEMVRDEGIEDVMLRESDPQAACEILVEQANAAGGVDNISVIVVQL